MWFLQPKRKQYDDFFEDFDAQCAGAGLNSKVPTCMKKLLTLSGYNSALSFKLVTEETLHDAEHFIEENHWNVVDEFDEYKNVTPFKFLPGHKALIFGIKVQIDDFQESKKLKKKMKLTAVLNEIELQTPLLHQLSSFTKNLGLKAVWTKDSLNDSTFTATECASFCTCTILCPLCCSSFNVRFDKHWKNSNIYKHLRKHLDPKKNGTTNSLTSEEIIEVEILQNGTLELWEEKMASASPNESHHNSNLS